jgi:formylglycine-generating enzyme required for sulfatase activity
MQPSSHEIGFGHILALIGLSILVVLLGAAIVGVMAPRPVPPTETSVPTVTPFPTPTPNPTFTSTPTLTPTPVPTATLEPSVTPTQEVSMALVAAGKFSMGSAEPDTRGDTHPAHDVSLNDFYIDIYEVTNASYAACVNAGVCSPPGYLDSATRESYYGNPEFDNYPVIQVTWQMAQTYCQWRGGSLPSEAQWEKAARGGLVQKPCPWGVLTPVCQDGLAHGARFDDNAACNEADTTRVGSYSPNGFGLYDMLGNVAEWVLDWYSATYYAKSPLENPLGPESGEMRIVRGGSWLDYQEYLRNYARRPVEPGAASNDIGFRCVRNP